MPRNAEVIRQWNLLRSVEGSRLGRTIDELAADAGVSTRTIRRDLAALMEAGFPLYDDRHESRTVWKLDGQPFKGVDASGFTLSEVCALYVGRSLVQSLVGPPFDEEIGRAFEKLDRALAPMRRFLDRLPQTLSTKSAERPRPTRDHSVLVGRLLEAILHRRQAAMDYHSVASARDKTYVVDALRLVYGDGGLYVLAFVPEYGGTRTFAVDRIRSLTLLESSFQAHTEASEGAFAHSLGIHEGPPQRVRLEFSRAVAPYVRERQWHPSQRQSPAESGALVIDLDVSVDWALKRWVLGFGGEVQVLSPPALAADIRREWERGLARYTAPERPAGSGVAAARRTRPSLSARRPSHVPSR
ncbi:MAG: WYL domain-containing protein [Vicinamibacterales bacterium]